MLRVMRCLRMGLLDYFKMRKSAAEHRQVEDKGINCPRCSKLMIKKTRQGLTIDKCMSCGGIWLDKGEIYKIIDNLQRDSSLNKNKKMNNKGGAWF